MLFDILLDVFKAVAQINEFAEVEAQFAQIPFVDVLFPDIELAEQLTGKICRRVEVHVVFLLNLVQIGDIPLHRFPLAGKRLAAALSSALSASLSTRFSSSQPSRRS